MYKDSEINEFLVYCGRLTKILFLILRCHMKKQKFTIEYPLSKASPAILWNSIGTAYGLSEWFADEVTTDDDELFTFDWNGHKQIARLVHFKQNGCIRFQWEEDEGTDAYFEMKIQTSELSKDVVLVVADFATKDDIKDATLLWNQQIKVLKRLTGM